MQTSLSIIIPTKNEEAYLPLLLQSIKIQTRQPTEIIVADAQSTDKTRAIAKKYGCRVVEGGIHPSIGRNKGAAVASSTLLLFLDADVILPDKKFLEATLEEIKERDISVACCLAMVKSAKVIDKIGIEIANFYFSATERIVKHGVGYCTFIYKHIHKQIGGYDEQIVVAEDIDYVTRASKFGKFRFLHSKKIIMSLRRYEVEGRWHLVSKYIFTLLHLLFSIKISKGRVQYSFNHKYPKRNR
ncbi:MAG TPA: glycosyltransferase [Candidatus Saccharimonadales bacterium]|nr:glycosyltransferase [Candidatus Saccharimonadales bacterium]